MVAPSGSGGATVVFIMSVTGLSFCLGHWALYVSLYGIPGGRQVERVVHAFTLLGGAWLSFFVRRWEFEHVDGGSPRVLKGRDVNGLLLRCSVPTVVKVAVASVCGVVSDVFVKRNMNTVTVTKLTIDFPLVGLIITFYALISTKNSALTSVQLKRGSVGKTARVLSRALVLYVAGSFFFKVLSFVFLSSVLIFFNTDTSALPCTHDFVRIVLLKAPVACAVVKLGGIVHTAKCPGGTVVASVTAILSGVVLTPVFVFRFR